MPFVFLGSNTMVSFREMKDRGYIPQKTYLKLMIGGGLSLSKVLLTSPGDLKKLRVIHGSEERFIRPKRLYELPPFEEGMKCAISDEKYLRPTLHCNQCAPEVVALANKLGAFKKSEYDLRKQRLSLPKKILT